MIDTALFVIFPYIAVILAVVFGVYRYYSDGFSYSSLSSQFLENKKLFWASVPWHYGIIMILTGHLMAVFFPTFWASVLGEPVRLYILEVSGLALAFITIIGIGGLIIRRFTDPRITAVTSTMDWILLTVLLIQVFTGIYTALFYRWGSLWFIESARPWLVSLLMLDPQVQYVAVLPWFIKLHIVGALVIVLLLPFTRLVHMFSVPVEYLIRPQQVVIWNRNFPWKQQ